MQDVRLFSIDVFRRPSWHPAWTGVAIALVTVAVYLTLEISSGRPQMLLAGLDTLHAGCPYLLGDYRISLVTAILVAYIIAARILLTDITRSSSRQLGVPEEQLVDAESLARSSSWGWLPGLVGLVIAFAAAIDISRQPFEWSLEYWIFPHTFNWLWCIPFGWMGGYFMYGVAMNSVLIYRLASRIPVTSLEDVSPQQDTLIRHGLRTTQLSFIFAGLLSVHFIDDGTGPYIASFIFFLFLGGAVISAFPTLGLLQAYHRYRDQRTEELRRELEQEELALLSNTQNYTPGRLADLIALEQRLNQWHLRLFRIPNLIRFLSYAVLGILSWMATTTLSTLIENILIP